MNPAAPWTNPRWQSQTRLILDSYRRWLGKDLIDREDGLEAEARNLFDAPIVVVSHDTSADPLLNYGNRRALQLWEATLDQLLGMPSRETAEPVAREERARMLERTSRDGYIDDYEGVRISLTGRRFHIRRATVWNLLHESGEPAGQAAAFVPPDG